MIEIKTFEDPEGKRLTLHRKPGTSEYWLAPEGELPESGVQVEPLNLPIIETGALLWYRLSPEEPVEKLAQLVKRRRTDWLVSLDSAAWTGIAAAVDAPAGDGRTALLRAILLPNPDVEMVRILLNMGAHPRQESLEKPPPSLKRATPFQLAYDWELLPVLTLFVATRKLSEENLSSCEDKFRDCTQGVTMFNRECGELLDEIARVRSRVDLPPPDPGTHGIK
jgi:hypothetical protein